MPDLFAGARIEVRMPTPPRIQVEQPAGPTAVPVTSPSAQWRAELATKLTGAAVSTDDSFSLPEPTGTGLEFVIVDGGLDDIRMDGVSL